jgi:hypothetical protein
VDQFLDIIFCEHERAFLSELYFLRVHRGGYLDYVWWLQILPPIFRMPSNDEFLAPPGDQRNNIHRVRLHAFVCSQ